jgi:hypothetical protein
MTPAVDKRVLLFLAGTMWILVGIYLLRLAWGWLFSPVVNSAFIYVVAGVIAALMVHHFGFLRVVDRNLGRILPMEGKRCVFSFMSWKSYVLVATMIAIGTALRHSAIPKPWLSVVYITIGLSLCLSSIRYLRILISQFNPHK